jgi:hypothetical protein
MWLGIAFAGVLLIIQARPSTAAYAGPDAATYISGVLMALGAAFLYAVAAIVTKKLGDTPPHLIALIQVCLGTVMLAPFANLANLPTDARAWADFVVMGRGVYRPGLCASVQRDPEAANARCGRAVLSLSGLRHGGGLRGFRSHAQAAAIRRLGSDPDRCRRHEPRLEISKSAGR